MILKLFSWTRFIIVLVILYAFCYEYLYKKYSTIIADFDEFNRRERFGHGHNVMDKLNITVKELKGQQFESGLKQQSEEVHVGEFKDFDNAQLQQYQQQKKPIMTLNSFREMLTRTLLPPKKVDSYQFNFYNWYKFELTFTDIGHDSYFEFRLSQKNKGSHEIVEKLGFKLPQRFYSLDKNDMGNKLDIDYKAKGIELRVEQVIVDAHYNDIESDGFENETFFHLTPNKTQLTEQEYKKFGSTKTLTKFNFTFTRKDYEINAHMSHIIRHNQCVTSYQKGLLRHKCMGGYGKGKISFSQFLRQGINTKTNQYNGNWERNSYNLDNSRVRTVFIGERYLKTSIISNIIAKYIPHIDLTTEFFLEYPSSSYISENTRKYIEIDFIGFNKPQYYSKRDRIQKQRWVGMSLYKPLNSDGSVMKESSHESFFFINGNVHPIYNIEFMLPLNEEGLRNGQILKFWNNNNDKEDYNNTSQLLLTPSFAIELQIQNSTLVQQAGVFSNKQVYRVDGYWRGWIDQGTLFTHNQTLKQQYNSSYQFGYVEFYEIEGTIKITQLINY